MIRPKLKLPPPLDETGEDEKKLVRCLVSITKSAPTSILHSFPAPGISVSPIFIGEVHAVVISVVPEVVSINALFPA